MATVYLNSSIGNDSNTYAQAQNSATPWLTFAKFLSGSSTNDTCSIAAGTYAWVTASIASRIITGAAPINGLPVVIFDGAAALATWNVTGTVTISNITFQNSTTTSNANYTCFFKAATTAVMTFSNCVFQNITFASTSNANGTQGLFGATNGSYPFSLTLNSCLINDFRNTGTGTNFAVFAFAFTTTPATILNVKNSTFYFKNQTSGVTFYVCNGRSTDIDATLSAIKNCIFANATGGASGTIQWFGNGGSITTVTYCNFNGTITSAPTGNTGCITSDPLFVDATNNNFNLRPTSPCIDTGTLV